MFNEDEIRKVIRQILDEGMFPENRTYDDAGLDVDGYTEFFFTILDRATPDPNWFDRD